MKKATAKASKPKSQALPTGQDPAKQAAALFQQLEKERGRSTVSMNTVVKSYPTYAVILAAEPEVHVEFVR